MRAAGPVVDPVPCSACGKLIDPLRAGHVAIFDQKVHYFCNRGVCRAAFLGEPPLPAALGEPPHVDLIRLATFQMEVGGWVDWARQVTREEASTPLGRADGGAMS